MSCTRPVQFTLLVAALGGCSTSAPLPPSGKGGGEVIPSGVISGQLTVSEADRPTRISEREPNNDFDDAQFIEDFERRIELLGALSADDAVDVYWIAAAEPSQATIVLSFDSIAHELDLAFSLFNLDKINCSGATGLDATFCVDTLLTPETGRFRIDGDFVLMIERISGDGSYEVGIELTPASAPTATPGFVPGEMLVRFESGTSAATCCSLLERCGFAEVARSPTGVCRARCTDAIPDAARPALTRHGVRWLSRRPEVIFAEPNGLYHPAAVPNDEFLDNQWNFDLINLPDAWDTTTGSDEVIVAVIDTGIIEHPDLAGRIIDGYDMIAEPAIARDGDGIDDDPTDEGDLAGGPGQSTYHGLHIAGTIGAATNNLMGVAGVTWATGIMPVRALGEGGGTSFDLAESVAYAAGLDNVSGAIPERRADIINLSVAAAGGTGPSQALAERIREAAAAGVMLVGASGNSGTDEPAFPAAYPEVLSVAACDSRLERASYSNFGPTIDITAPGGDLGLDLDGDGYGDGILSLGFNDSASEPTLTLQQGTSMACPHITGVLALMRAANPTLEPSDLKAILSATAWDVGDPGRDDEFGAGIVDAAGAVAAASARLGNDPLEPLLSLSTTSIDLGRTLVELRVLVANSGDGLLEIENITVEERIGEGWLEIVPGAGNDHVSIASLTVRVDRSRLDDGRYVGVIMLTSAGGISRTIDVAMSVGRSLQLDEDIFVVVIDAVTRETIGQATTSAERDFGYRIRSLPAGTYRVYAGTDRDNDGQICDLGELCGALPSPIEARSITLEIGEERQNVDFAVGELIFQSQSAPLFPSPEGIRLAHPEADR